MITYEVNLDVDAALRTRYLVWLRAHVDEMLRFEGFGSAVIEGVVEPLPADGRFRLSVRYHVRDQACLDDYLTHHAPSMRADGLANFADGFRAHRRILRPLDAG